MNPVCLIGTGEQVKTCFCVGWTSIEVLTEHYAPKLMSQIEKDRQKFTFWLTLIFLIRACMWSRWGNPNNYECLTQKHCQRWVELRNLKCVQVGHRKKIGEVIEEYQREGWRLHTYQAQGVQLLSIITCCLRKASNPRNTDLQKT